MTVLKLVQPTNPPQPPKPPRKRREIDDIFGNLVGTYLSALLLTFGYVAHKTPGIDPVLKALVGLIAGICWPFYWVWTLFDWILG